MLMIKARSIFLTFCLMFLVSGIVTAKNNDLQDDMVDLERVYISALALTGGDKDAAYPAMLTYEEEWTIFIGKYEFYRSNKKNETTYRNWTSYLHHVGDQIAKARDLINNSELLLAHEELEEIRTTMAEFRGRSGFPKFIADDFTAFHSIMGDIIRIAGGELDGNALAILDELYIEASHAWSKVEKNPVDLYEWYFETEDEIATYDNFIVLERDALDNFESILSDESSTEAQINIAAKMLKPNQAQAYMMLSTLPKP